jgi:recombination protein RecR
MSFGPVIEELIQALRVLPGVGQKSAQRMALSLLEGKPQGSFRLAESLSLALGAIGECKGCRTLTESEFCPICMDGQRDQKTLCVVESPSDLIAIEQMHQFNGVYFVLKGSLSPLDGKGPAEIGIPALLDRVRDLDVREIILATNPTVEGEATAHYIAEIFSHEKVLITRLAHGIPMGSNLGYIDGSTLSHAFSGRKPVLDES